MSRVMSDEKVGVREISYLKAISEAQREEMERDDTVFMMGEDIQSRMFGTTDGFVRDFGVERIRNTPISEAGFVGAAAGAAMLGMRPIVDLQVASFLYVALDQVVSIIAKSTYLYGGQTHLPLVIRLSMLYRAGNAAQHSDRPYPMLMGIPGLKIVAPSSAADVKGLLKSAIRDDNPVICFEDGSLWASKSPVPEDPDLLVPLGVGDVKREGSDITLVGVAGGVHAALAAADMLAGQGISAEVVDPRTLVPLDLPLILESVAKTGALVVVDPAHRTCSAASEIAAGVAEFGYSSLRAPIARVTTPDVHIPFSKALEHQLYPSSERVVQAALNLLGKA